MISRSDDCAHVRRTVCDPAPENRNAISNRFEEEIVERSGSVLYRFLEYLIDQFAVGYMKQAFASPIFLVFVTGFVVPWTGFVVTWAGLRSLLTSFHQPRQLRFAEQMEVKTNLEMDAARERFGSLLDQFSVSLLVQSAIGHMKQAECVLGKHTFNCRTSYIFSNECKPL